MAVTGVSRKPKNHGSNAVYKRLRERGYEVFAVNPNADEVEGDPRVPRSALDPWRRRRGRDRHEAGDRRRDDARVRRARHQARLDAPRPRRRQRLGAATEYGRQRGITRDRRRLPVHVRPTADLGHKAMRLVFTLTGNVPKQV